MTDAQPFALVVLFAAAVGLVAVLSNRLTERVKSSSPAIVLAAEDLTEPGLSWAGKNHRVVRRRFHHLGAAPQSRAHARMPGAPVRLAG